MENYNSDSSKALKMRVVHGKSMYPFLQPASVLVYKKVPEHHLHIGDLIVFGDIQNPPYSSSHIVHRLVKKIKTIEGKILYQAKGDANHSYDEPIAYEDVIGKVYLIEAQDKLGAKQLLELDNWRTTMVNYLLAKTSCYKSMAYRILRYFYHRLKYLLLLIKKITL